MAADHGCSRSLRIRVESKPPETRLSEIDFKCWPKYQLKYDAEQTCHIVRGKVRAYCNTSSSSHMRGSSNGGGEGDAEDGGEEIRRRKDGDEGEPAECVEFGAGDLVTIPKGLRCTWDVSVSVDMFYKFESSSFPW
ncbi:hypothetical protein SAY86_015676 [Trapa natans]|uniref:(S)-ureidoglycine aminohydrolase cupin domain-containing protein n=1 Tax=Trapa natans TaxID=22666 RepID=A0AAN7LCE9_TRANT|nr:hypothetical protein SAY86_015676 [Trapa natans]